MQFTGERYIPTEQGQVKYEHIHRYAVALPFVTGKSVLDIASGEGYGAAMLSGVAASVIGVDIDSAVIGYAQEQYSAIPNLEFRVGSCTNIPLPDAAVDLVISFETLEHLDQHEQMLREIKRVLKPGGALILSSPNRKVYSDEANYTNPYHVKELYYDELRDLLDRYFGNVQVYGQNFSAASLIFPLTVTAETQLTAYSGDARHITQKTSNLATAKYFIALCADVALDPPFVFDSLYVDPQADILRDKDRIITDAQGYVADLLADQARLNQSIAEQNAALLDKENEITALRDSFVVQQAESTKQHTQAQAELHERLARQQAENREQLAQLQAAKGYITDLHAHIYHLNKRVGMGVETEALHAEIARLQELISGREGYVNQLQKKNASLAQIQEQVRHLEDRLRQQFMESEKDRSEIQRLAQVESDLRALQGTHSVRLSRSMGIVTTIVRQALKAPLEPPIIGTIDSPAPNTHITGNLSISGWAVSRSGWITRVDVLLGDKLLGTATYGLPRPDVIIRRPLQMEINCGYSGTFFLDPSHFTASAQILTIQVTNTAGHVETYTRSVTLDLPPFAGVGFDAAIYSTATSTTLAADAGTVTRIPLEPGIKTVKVFAAASGNHFMIEIAQVFVEGFKASGFCVELCVDETPSSHIATDEFQLIVAPHEFYPLYLEKRYSPEEVRQISRATYVLNVEQPGTNWFEAAFKNARYARGVWDINKIGVKEFIKRNVPATHAPLGFAPQLQEYVSDAVGAKPTDILFLASSSPRRDRFLAQNAGFLNKYNCQLIMSTFDHPNLATTPGFFVEHARNQLVSSSKILLNVHTAERKYFEWHRVLLAIANRCLVISEPSEHIEPLINGEHVIITELDNLAETCQYYLEHEAERLKLTEQAYQFVTENLHASLVCEQLLGQYRSTAE